MYTTKSAPPLILSCSQNSPNQPTIAFSYPKTNLPLLFAFTSGEILGNQLISNTSKREIPEQFQDSHDHCILSTKSTRTHQQELDNNSNNNIISLKSRWMLTSSSNNVSESSEFLTSCTRTWKSRHSSKTTVRISHTFYTATAGT